MQTPTTYSEWAILLQKFGAGDDSVLAVMDKGSFTLDAGTATRFYKIVNDSYENRKQLWLDWFSKMDETQVINNEAELEIMLRNSKQYLRPLFHFSSIQGFPKDIKNVIKEDFQEFVSEIQKSLKDSIPKLASNREIMIFVFNNFDFYFKKEQKSTTNSIKPSRSTHKIPTSGRKIIF